MRMPLLRNSCETSQKKRTVPRAKLERLSVLRSGMAPTSSAAIIFQTIVKLHVDHQGSCFNINLMGTVFSSVDISTKLSAMSVSRGFQELLQCAAAWEPLVVEKDLCRNMFLALRAEVPWRLPKACYQVSTIDIHLMDPENYTREQSDTEDEDQRLFPLLPIVCPMSEFLFFQNSFQNLSKLTLRNLDSIGMRSIYSYRPHSLQEFGFVEIQYAGSKRYHLIASKAGPPFVDSTKMASLNASRIPATVRRHDNTSISEREALFLLENPTAYKNGKYFGWIHLHRYHTLDSHHVRKSYKDLLESLRKRFPNSFS